jgi:hypothetical protein
MSPRARLTLPFTAPGHALSLRAAALAAALWLAAAGAAAAAGPSPAAGAPWPQLAPLSQRYTLEPPHSLRVVLKGTKGEPAYLLECRSDAAAAVQCGLHEAQRAAGASLLVRAGLRDRGLFRAPDLQGACASYPQFGRQRSFRLRGFELSLALLDVPAATAGGRPRQAVQLDVQPDPLASAAQAEAPEVPDPQAAGHSCQAPPPVADPFSCRKPEVEVTKPTCTQ